ncbi:MAG TPA: hypothetical protein VHC94_03860 [Nitrobacter sp.]|jgi:hypothetical protein|nr:hypothetical protein [Nitrobacter sp.]
MRRSQRLIASAVLVSLCTILAGCSSGMDDFDPTTMFDFLDSKKKLPGKREQVFPDGVPGIEQGVPKDLYKSNVEREQQEQAAAAAAAAATPTPDAAGAKEAAAGKPAATAAEVRPARPPKKKKLIHRRATSLPKEKPAAQDQQAAPQQQPAQQSQPAASPFPAPLPSGSFSR